MELVKMEYENLKGFRTEIQIIQSNDDIWFKGKDIAIILGYKDTPSAIREHVDSEDKIKWNELKSLEGVGKLPTPKEDPQTVYINESGLYSLILSSKLPSAKRFKKWVTSEVLPKIRKTGKYAPAQESHKPMSLNDSIAKIKEIKALEVDTELQQLLLDQLKAELKPKSIIKAQLEDEKPKIIYNENASTRHHMTDNYWERD